MDIEFHYYMTHLIGLRAGFGEADAHTIAFASQYTDDNDHVYRIEGGGTPFENSISQTSDISRPQEERLNIYPIFHFCPGTKTEIVRRSPLRGDGRTHRLATVPDNGHARRLFSAALNSRSLYRIGIAAHLYADTFCHCDFAGCKDDFNWIRIEGLIPGLLDDIVPCIGHALALRQPDIPCLVWEDTRLISGRREKRNKHRILTAAGNVFDFFSSSTKLRRAASVRTRLLGDLDEAIGGEADSDTKARREERMKNYTALLGTAYKRYDADAWFDAAVMRSTDPQSTAGTFADIYSWRGDYRMSHWYNFQEAVRSHKAGALAVLGRVFHKAGNTLSAAS